LRSGHTRDVVYRSVDAAKAVILREQPVNR
jgi:hypothetical protein